MLWAVFTALTYMSINWKSTEKFNYIGPIDSFSWNSVRLDVHFELYLHNIRYSRDNFERRCRYGQRDICIDIFLAPVLLIIIVHMMFTLHMCADLNRQIELQFKYSLLNNNIHRGWRSRQNRSRNFEQDLCVSWRCLLWVMPFASTVLCVRCGLPSRIDFIICCWYLSIYRGSSSSQIAFRVYGQ
jgi:hypothetical protein